MPKINVTLRTGQTRELSFKPGHSLMETLRHNGVDEIEAICGGSCSCATCHVYVEPGFEASMPTIGDDENDLLDCSDHRRPTSRLSCQVPMTEALDGLKVEVAPQD
jgi:ferredoxin, 2Fe-2S